MENKGFFLITIDGEGDNLWNRPRYITVKNADALARFQMLCEAYGFKTTYLTDFELAQAPSFRELGRNILKRGTGEIGMHLHAWNTPPLVPLTVDDFYFQPYLMDYPEELIRQKVATMTGLLEDTFNTKILSHRAGRWAINKTYARILAEYGYCIDCSVTPHIVWTLREKDENQTQIVDYTGYPDEPYFMDLGETGQQGRSTLLEVPMTIVALGGRFRKSIHKVIGKVGIAGRLIRRFYPEHMWLRPRKGNLGSLLKIVDQAREEGRSYIMMMLHSSELMAGSSPDFPRQKDIEGLYRDVEILFQYIRQYFQGAALADYYHAFCDLYYMQGSSSACKFQPEEGGWYDG